MKKRNLITFSFLTMAVMMACGSKKTDQNTDNVSENQEMKIPVETTTANVPLLTLNNGVKMPQFGLGTYSIPEGEETYYSVMTALQAGYRHIDTAHAYGNERSVGKAVKDSGIDRDSIWITSKLWPNEYGEGKTLEAIERMRNRLGVEYIDLVYFHQPVGDYVGGWKEMEQALESGKVKAIGISNFDVNDSIFNSIVETARIKPQVMQIELHPYAQREYWQEMAKKQNIQIESWFPLGGRESNGELLRDETINEIARNHGKSPAQILIRWQIQKGFSVIPGASNPDYIKENIQVFDFELSPEEMERIHKLNQERRFFNMPYEDQVKWFSSAELID